MLYNNLALFFAGIVDCYNALSTVSPRGRCSHCCPGSHCVLHVFITVTLGDGYDIVNKHFYMVSFVFILSMKTVI